MNLACPRCDQLLVQAVIGEREWRTSLLCCPESHCDYALVLSTEEIESLRRRADLHDARTELVA